MELSRVGIGLGYCAISDEGHMTHHHRQEHEWHCECLKELDASLRHSEVCLSIVDECGKLREPVGSGGTLELGIQRMASAPRGDKMS